MTNSEFSEIVNSTKTIVLSAIEKNLAERFFHSIDDVVQETYLRAYKALVSGKFREESKLSTWLYTIAKNESYRMNQKLMREEKKLEKVTLKLKEGESSENSFSEKPNLLIQYLKQIPEKYKTILQHYSDGFSEKEIAEKLSIKPGTVKSRAFRGKELLRKIAFMGDKK